MIAEAMILFAIAALIILLVAKAYNLMKLCTFYDKTFIFLGVAIILICWALLFFGMSGLAVAETTATLTDTASPGIVTVVQSNNSVIEATMLFYLGNFLILFSLVLSAAELFYAFGTGIVEPRRTFNTR